MEEPFIAEVLEPVTSWWLLQIGIVVAITMLAAFILNSICVKSLAKTSGHHHRWKHVVMHAAQKPIIALCFILGGGFALYLVYVHTQTAILGVIPLIQKIASIAVGTWFAIKSIHGGARLLEHRASKGHNKLDKATIRAISKLLGVFVIITTSLIALQTLGFSLSGLLAVGGIGGIALGFASKDLLADFFGGVMLHFDRPFAVGDWIRSPDKQLEGYVEEIRWRITRVRTFDKRLLFIPNSLFSTIIVENASKMTHRRIYETMGLRYQDLSRVSLIVDEIRSMLRAHPEVDANQTLIVHLTAFAAYSVDLLVAVYIKQTESTPFARAKEDVLIQISNIVDKHGASFAFPTSQVTLSDPIEIIVAPKDLPNNTLNEQ